MAQLTTASAPSKAHTHSNPAPDLTQYSQASHQQHQAQSQTTRSGRVSRPPPEPQTEESDSGSQSGFALRKIGRPVTLGPDERLARQRKRNRESAMRARQRKKAQDDDAYKQLDIKKAECDALEQKCKALEGQVKELQALLQRTHGLSPRAIQLLLPETSNETVKSTESSEGSRQSPQPAPTATPTSAAREPVPPSPGRWWNAASPAATPISFLRGAPTPKTYTAEAPTSTITPQPSAGTFSQPTAFTPQASFTPQPSTFTPQPSTFTPQPSTFTPNHPAESTYLTPAAPTAVDVPDLSNVPLPETFSGGDDYELLSLSALFGFDDDDEQDADFIPPTSPKADEESSDDEAEGEDGDEESRKRRRVDEEEDFIPEVAEEASDEEEDLFLPIEDVPVPVDQLYRDAMEALGVSTQAELGAVVGRIVDAASKGHVTAEEVEGIRRLMRLAEAQGMYRS